MPKHSLTWPSLAFLCWLGGVVLLLWSPNTFLATTRALDSAEMRELAKGGEPYPDCTKRFLLSSCQDQLNGCSNQEQQNCGTRKCLGCTSNLSISFCYGDGTFDVVDCTNNPTDGGCGNTCLGTPWCQWIMNQCTCPCTEQPNSPCTKWQTQCSGICSTVEPGGQ
jgi:hypothetical protein